GVRPAGAPGYRAVGSSSGLVSTPTTRPALAITAPGATDKPMPPSPNAATEEPGRTLAVFSTAPMPVVMPQPSRQTLSSGARAFTFATAISGSTVYSEKVLVPM